MSCAHRMLLLSETDVVASIPHQRLCSVWPREHFLLTQRCSVLLCVLIECDRVPSGHSFDVAADCAPLIALVERVEIEHGVGVCIGHSGADQPLLELFRCQIDVCD